MLSLSAGLVNTDVDLQMVNGDESQDGGGVTFGLELLKLAEAIAGRDEVALRLSREQLLAAAGPAVLVDAAGVAANFQRMVRIADATGIPEDTLSGGLSKNVRAELGLDRFHTAQYTPPLTPIQQLQGVIVRLIVPWIVRWMNRDK